MQSVERDYNTNTLTLTDCQSDPPSWYLPYEQKQNQIIYHLTQVSPSRAIKWSRSQPRFRFRLKINRTAGRQPKYIHSYSHRNWTILGAITVGIV
jgi:hypothetical protein